MIVRPAIVRMSICLKMSDFPNNLRFFKFSRFLINFQLTHFYVFCFKEPYVQLTIPCGSFFRHADL